MSKKKLRIRVEQPWIAYPGSTIQQNYAESAEHGYLLWDIKARDDFAVNFQALPNPRPFVTIDWMGSVKETLEVARDYPDKSRFRVRHRDILSHKDTVLLTQQLKQELSASEVTFKGEQQAVNDYFTTGEFQLMKSDLRNPEVLVKLVKEFYQDAVFADEEWAQVLELIRRYLININDDAIRNVFWSLKHLKFDNLFCYGDDNNINFQNLHGIVGIFGPNRSGKSSLPGTLMYALFNSTDRGSIKNLHVVNSRRLYGLSRVILTINGIDYAIERQTVKNENKRGDVTAATQLNFFRVDDGAELADLNGEQRTDTEKTIRQHIGTVEDIALTSISTQGEINQVIELGSSKRNQMMSKFLDLDIFYKMHDLAAKEVSSIKSQLKAMPEQDWIRLAQEKQKSIQDCDRKIEQLTHDLSEAHERLSVLRNESFKHRDVILVTQFQVEQQRERVESFIKQVEDMKVDVATNDDKVKKNLTKLETITALRQQYDLVELRKRQEALRKLESTLVNLKHTHGKEAATYRQQKRAVKILQQVPCKEQFPSCSFIKDAHETKLGLSEQQTKVKETLVALESAETSLEELKVEDLIGKIKKLEDLNALHSQLTSRVSELRVQNVKLETSLKSLIETLEIARSKYMELSTAYQNDENVEVVAIRNEIDTVQTKIQRMDREKLDLATRRGREAVAIETLVIDKKKRQTVLQKMRIHELVAVAFSKKGIPNYILSQRLPVINGELTKILAGIVDFTVELERDEDSDQLEIFINYGDSRRIIDLASGMEKAISSIALRVALRNVSSLPKSDFFIIDEGFGVFDEAGVEACNRLLVSLKRYFRLIMVITHIDAVKDIADFTLEITKNEKESKVNFL